MYCILHGYLLEGSGSNLWTRCVVEALCRDGHTVHLVCQEPHPEQYDCIAEARRYAADGSVQTLFRRDVPYRGKCIMHKPWLGDTLPVFVWDRYEEFPNPVPMIHLTDEAIEEYLRRNVRVVSDVVRRHGIHAIHANHAALMAVVAQRVSEATGVPYAVMPHGSELEYALKRDERFLRWARGSLAGAGRVFVLGAEMRARLAATVEGVPGLEEKFSTLPLGVHTWQFEPVPRERRREKMGRLLVALAEKPRGRRPDQLEAMLGAVARARTTSELRAAFTSIAYDTKAPDADLEEKLEQVDWEHDAILLFVGRLISAKGVQAGLAALPMILAEDPFVRLLLVGHGPLREVMEAFVWGLERGDRALVERIVDCGRELEGDPDGAGGVKRLGKVADYFDDLRERGELDRYFELARDCVRADRVIFTGYLTHQELQYLFPCCDLGIFPSLVKEAGPLVFLEALASGCFPLGTNFGGMKASIDAIADLLPPRIVDAMRVDPHHVVADIVSHTATALRIGVRYKDVLARAAQERHDWTSVARRLAHELDAIAAEAAGASLEPRAVSFERTA
jgi:glycosyltransferase involved in cell wall biosynthesis